MFRIRWIYPEEISVYKRLFYITEGRNLTENDYTMDKEYINFKPNMSVELVSILERMMIETIWAPLWVEGLARGFFSDSAETAAHIANLSTIPEISWSIVYGQVVFVDRNQYEEAKNLAENFKKDWIFVQNVPWKRLVVGGLSNQPAIGDFRKIPEGTTVRMLESYLFDHTGFIFENLNNLEEKVTNNYFSTRSRRVPGGRKPQQFADLGWSIKLDSFDELYSLLYPEMQQIIPKGVPLHFLPNSRLSGKDAKIWELPVAVGDEDLHLELSFYRDTGQIDPEYFSYRESRILNMDSSKKELFLI